MAQTKKQQTARKISRPKARTLRLVPHLVPRRLWRRSICNALGKDRKAWRDIRRRTFESANGACEICGATREKGMICHELWQYDIQPRTATLTGFQLICPDCNAVIHLGMTFMVSGLQGIEVGAKHMAKVNGMTLVATNEILRNVKMPRHPLDGKPGQPKWTIIIIEKLKLELQ